MQTLTLQASRKTKKTPIGEIPVDWGCVRLGEILMGKPEYGANASSVEFIEGRTPRYIRITDIDEDGNLIQSARVGLPAELGKGCELAEGDLLIARSGATVGKCFVYQERYGSAVYAGYLIRFRIDEARCHLPFVVQWLRSPYFKKWIDQTSKAGAQPNINAEEYQSLSLPLPPLPAQQAIAAILSTWDRAIEKLQALLTAKTERKRGLMQQLLTGKTRFKAFIKSNKQVRTHFGPFPADWPVVQIGGVSDEMSEKNCGGSELPVLSCTKHRGLVNSLEYFGRRMFSEDTTTYKVVRRGDFAYATNHIEEGSIGYQNLHDAALISPMYTVFRTKKGVDHSFLFKLLKTELYRHIFETNTNGSINRRGALRWDDFAHIKVHLPSEPEQHRIAAVLETCAREIEFLKKQLDALKEQKRGLMQKLLTGQIRVNT
ncbi:MAG: restriction endonuclease subunit S [Verrucomicrobia bacterium]|nr:restriction endonuclease subunit S [Verrucomicrobiota bacterium]